VLRYFKVVNRTVADALADHGLAPIDVTMVINTHLHFVTAAEPGIRARAADGAALRARTIFRERDEVTDWIEASGMAFELVDGDLAWPQTAYRDNAGHTSGISRWSRPRSWDRAVHRRRAYTRAIWNHRIWRNLPDGQAADADAWHDSLTGLKALMPMRVHFCHDG